MGHQALGHRHHDCRAVCWTRERQSRLDQSSHSQDVNSKANCDQREHFEATLSHLSLRLGAQRRRGRAAPDNQQTRLDIETTRCFQEYVTPRPKTVFCALWHKKHLDA